MRKPDSGPFSVLIVEDDRSLLRALTFALGTEGFEIHPYADGQSLLAESDILADCLVIDQKLPGVDGLSLLAKLREREVAAPAILITSNPDRLCRQRARAAGVPIVEKPLLDGALRWEIEQVVEASPLEARPPPRSAPS